MIDLSLNHELTPPELRSINDQIIQCLSCDNPSELALKFNQLVIERERHINNALASLSVERRELFVTNELKVNEQLNALAQSLLQSAKQEIVQYMRGRAAVKKYK